MNRSSYNQHQVCSLVIIGAPRCGKTELIRCLDPEAMKSPTRENPYGSMTYSLNYPLNGATCPLSVTEMDDEAIQPDTPTFKWPEAVTDADGVILCYDVTNRSTFMTMPELLDAFTEHKAPTALVGCKVEASSIRDVETKLGQKLASLFDCRFREIAMIMPDNTNEFFDEYLKEVIRKKEILQQRHQLLLSKDKLETKYDSLRTQLRQLRQQNQAAVLLSTSVASPSPAPKSPSASPTRSTSSATDTPQHQSPRRASSAANLMYPMPIVRPKSTSSPGTPASPHAVDGTAKVTIRHHNDTSNTAPASPIPMSTTINGRSDYVSQTPETRPESISTSTDSFDGDSQTSGSRDIYVDPMDDDVTMKDVSLVDDVMNAPPDSSLDAILNDYAIDHVLVEDPKRSIVSSDTRVSPSSEQIASIGQPRQTHAAVTPTGFTTDELVDRLTSPDVHDMEFTKVFLLLYRKFLRPSEFLDKLMDRFDAYDCKDEVVYARGAPIHPVQLRVCNVLVHWCQDYWTDFASDRMRFTLHVFLEICSTRPAFAAVCQKLASLAFRESSSAAEQEGMDWGLPDVDELDLNKLQHTSSKSNEANDAAKAHSQRNSALGHNSYHTSNTAASPRTESDDYTRSESLSSLSSNNSSSSSRSLDAPAQKLLETAAYIQTSFLLSSKPSASSLGVDGGSDIHHTFLNTPFLDLDNDAIAYQLNLLEWQTFARIKPRDLLQHIWSKKNKGRHPPSIAASIDHFNFLSKWVQTRILLQRKTKLRAKTMSKFMKIAIVLRNSNNYNSLMAVLAGLNSAPIARLHNTRRLLMDKSTFHMYEAIEKLMASEKSFAAYRHALKKSDLPCIPYLGLFFRDLLYIDEMNKDRRLDGAINLPKFLLMGDTVMMIRNFQQRAHQVTRDPYITRVISDTPVMSDDDAYHTSLELEPRIS
ncbi:hypothetical protein SeLEV6574_g03628 [Synchytrium endobioticum]|nr:hypothetical protein SeLEV6574_g03628 [Synchytrium endobioticum]